MNLVVVAGYPHYLLLVTALDIASKPATASALLSLEGVRGELVIHEQNQLPGFVTELLLHYPFRLSKDAMILWFHLLAVITRLLRARWREDPCRRKLIAEAAIAPLQ
jgi:hypothetical protein